MAQWVKNPPAMQETQEMQVRSLDWEDTLEKKMATYSSILAWKILLGKCVYIYLSIYIHIYVYVLCLVAQSCPTLCDPMELTRLLCPWGFSRTEYWNGLPCPPSGDLPKQGLNPSLPNCRWILYCLSHRIYMGFLCICIYIDTYTHHIFF